MVARRLPVHATEPRRVDTGLACRLAPGGSRGSLLSEAFASFVRVNFDACLIWFLYVLVPSCLLAGLRRCTSGTASQPWLSTRMPAESYCSMPRLAKFLLMLLLLAAAAAVRTSELQRRASAQQLLASAARVTSCHQRARLASHSLREGAGLPAWDGRAQITGESTDQSNPRSLAEALLRSCGADARLSLPAMPA